MAVSYCIFNMRKSSVSVRDGADLKNELIGVFPDGKGRDQPACQEGWKMCRKEKRIVMPM
jgi:hypothetical protein